MEVVIALVDSYRRENNGNVLVPHYVHLALSGYRFQGKPRDRAFPYYIPLTDLIPFAEKSSSRAANWLGQQVDNPLFKDGIRVYVSLR